MSERDIDRWHDAIHPDALRPKDWEIRAGGSWDMAKVQPITDEMLAELVQRFHYAGCPWNCRSMPLSASDREYMYLLYYSMQGLVARMRKAERDVWLQLFSPLGDNHHNARACPYCNPAQDLLVSRELAEALSEGIRRAVVSGALDARSMAADANLRLEAIINKR